MIKAENIEDAQALIEELKSVNRIIKSDTINVHSKDGAIALSEQVFHEIETFQTIRTAMGAYAETLKEVITNLGVEL